MDQNQYPSLHLLDLTHEEASVETLKDIVENLDDFAKAGLARIFRLEDSNEV